MFLVWLSKINPVVGPSRFGKLGFCGSTCESVMPYFLSAKRLGFNLCHYNTPMQFFRSFGILAARVCAAAMLLTTASVAQAAPGEPLQPENPTGVYPSPGNTVFGVEMAYINTEWGLEYVKQTDVRMVRKNGLVWSQVEASEGQRNWDSQAALEQELRNAAAQNWEVMLVVRSAPAWAQADPPWHCSTVLDNKLAAFGAFVHDAVARYSQPPFSVKYFEIWNEPDVDHRPFFPNTPNFQSWYWPFGCMGDYTDSYYGGAHFAKMMQAAYAPAKAANPTAQVLVGGLLYSCKPPINFDVNNIYCNMGRFMEGVLRGGGGPYFDGISFHAYDYYCNRNTSPMVGHCESYTTSDYANRDWQTSSQTLPSVIVAKARQLKTTLANYGLSGKTLYASESAIICELDTGGRCAAIPGQRDADYELMKAYYTPRLMAGGMVEGLQGVFYYDVRDYCENQDPFGSSLLNCDGSYRPAAYAFKFATQKLHNATYKREITEYAGLTGYEFDRAGRKLWVIWTKDRAAHSIRLPRLPVGMWDAQGNALAPTPVVSIGQNTTYVEWAR